MRLREIYEVTDHEIVIKFPNELEGKKVVVTVHDYSESREAKLLLMNSAMTDPGYLADLNEVMNDFANTDDEYS